MAKYEIVEMPKMNGKDEVVLYPKLKHIRMMDDGEFMTRMDHEPNGVTAAMAENVLSAAANLMSRLLSEGYSVKLKGIGTFKASLGMKKDKGRETEDDKRNARSVEVKNIVFKADKQFVEKTDRSCYLERDGVKRISPVTTTFEERRDMAVEFLKSHPFLTVAAYAAMTGLNRSAAGKELKKIAKTEGSGIVVSGRSPHIIYVKG